MKAWKDIFDSLGALLIYPDEKFEQRLGRCRELGEELHEETAEKMIESFAAATITLSPGEREELYTRTFDINPVSSLEVGWHLHGETYDRGTFLVQMRAVLRRCNIEESSELPDHLTHAMQAAGRMNKAEADEFINNKLLKAIDKMLEGFSDQNNPYEKLLLAAREVLSMYATPSVGV